MRQQSNHQRKPQLRCIGDLFGYCSEKPQPISEILTIPYLDYGGKPKERIETRSRCKKDPMKCPHYLTQTMLIKC